MKLRMSMSDNGGIGWLCCYEYGDIQTSAWAANPVDAERQARANLHDALDSSGGHEWLESLAEAGR